MLSKINQIADGLGLCRQCKFLSYNGQQFINIGDYEWYLAYCNRAKLPCYITRSSLVQCRYFKTKTKKGNFLTKLFQYLTNGWSPK